MVLRREIAPPDFSKCLTLDSSMDMTAPSEGADAGSIPARGT